MKDYEEIARHEGLRYVSDNKPGFTRKKHNKKFDYFDLKGKKITSEKEIKRINSIGIPPAYHDVWICPDANGHIQATALDDKGRKQYRYHAQWRSALDESKFEHILHFGESLPAIRKCVEEHMKLSGMPREKVMATVINLLEKTFIRVGNSEYAKSNNSYGLTTLRKKHIEIDGANLKFRFKGKSGKEWNLSMHDKRIAAIVKRCAEIPGHELFKYIDGNGDIHDVTSQNVNDYLKEVSNNDFTAKDFRTWSGTVLAAIALNEFEHYDSGAQAKKNVVKAIEKVAKQLGNTPAICRKCYIHPEIINSYLDNGLKEMIEREIDKKLKTELKNLTDEEIMVLAFLRKKLQEK